MTRYKGTIVRTYFATAALEVEAPNVEAAKDLIFTKANEGEVCWSGLRGFEEDEIEDLAEVEADDE